MRDRDIRYLWFIISDIRIRLIWSVISVVTLGTTFPFNPTLVETASVMIMILILGKIVWCSGCV